MPVGLPYNNWNPRPVKNGQPPPCNLPQCNGTFAGRKVGAAMKRLPQLYYGDKAKEQILQKWDPATKSMTTIRHDYSPPIIAISSNWNLNSNTITAIWNEGFSNDQTVLIKVYRNTTNSSTGATQLDGINYIIGTVGNNIFNFNYIGTLRNYYFFTIQPIRLQTTILVSPIYRLDWFVNSLVPNVVQGQSVNLTRGIAIDDIGNIYTTQVNSPIRIIKTTPGGISTTFISLSTAPTGIYIKSNTLYVTQSNDTILTFNVTNGASTGSITLPFAAARALVMDSLNNMYIQNSGATIFKRSPGGTVTQILTDTGTPCGNSMGYYKDSSNNEYIYYAQTYAATPTSTIMRTKVVDGITGEITSGFTKTIVAGNGTEGYSGDGGSAITSQLRRPRGVAVDNLGNVMIIDTENCAVRYVVASTGIIYTICGLGNGTSGPPTDGVVGTTSLVNLPWAGIFKDNNTAYFTDSNNNVSRVLNLTGHY